MITQLKKLFAIVTLLGLAPFAAAQPVLTNGGFEQSPPNSYGNNINWPIAPWVLGAGQTNVVSVDGPGGSTWYGSLGPASDATGGTGNFQHYFDQANISGMGTISQSFVPKCTGEVSYGTYFSSRSGASGTAEVSILDASGTVVSGPATVTVPNGNSETDPWLLASFTANLTANLTYDFRVDMDNQLNMDNAYVVFETQCDEHTPPCFVTNTCNQPETNVEAVKTCEQATYNLDGSYDLNCTITVDIDTPAPAQTVIYDQFSVGGTLTQLAINSATSVDAWACGHSAVTPNPLTEFSCVLNAADVPVGGQSVIDVNLTIPADTDITDVKNCSSGKYTPLVGTGSDRIDESCVEIVFPPEPPEPNCVPFKQGAFKCDAATGTYVVELTNTALPNFDPSDVRIVSVTPGVTISQNPSNPLEMAITGATAGQVIRIKTEAIHENGGEGRGIDLCCMGEMEITIPDDMPCEGPVDVSVNKVWQDFIDFAELGYTGTQVPPHGFHVTVDVPVGTLQPGDVVTVSDPTSGQINVTSFGSPLAPAPWNCVEIGGAWTCTYLVPATGAVMPADIYWPAIKDGESHVKNCADVALSRGGQTVQETSLANNQSCWEENAPIPQAELEIFKYGPPECRSGEPCVFTYTVSNTGTEDFNDAITLDDTVTNTPLSGQTSFGASGGNFVSISPALCPIADLTSGLGCTGNVSIPAGGSEVFTVTYNPPIFSGEGDFAIENCVGLSSVLMPLGADPLESCHLTEITKPQLEIVKSGPAECPIGQPCDFTVTINNTSTTGYSGPVLLSDTTNVSQFVVSNVTPMPAGCGGSLPANPFACVTNISLAAGASTSYTFTMTPLMAGGQVVPESGENCARLGGLPVGAPTGDYSFQYYGSGTPTITQPFADLMQTYAPIGESCVPLVVTDPPVETPEFNVFKECGPITETDAGTVYPLSMDCVIKIQPLTPFTGSLVITDVGSNLSGGGQGAISGGVLPSHPSVTCSGSGLSMSCVADPNTYPIDGSGFPMEVQIPLTMSFQDTGGPITWQNCAGGNYTFNTGAQMNVSDYCVSQSYTPPSACTPVPEIAGDQIDNDCDGEVDEVTESSNLTTTKTCSPIVVDEHALQGVSQCSITLAADNLPSGQIITLQDVMTASNGSSIPFIGSFANVTGAPAGMACADTTNGAASCTISSDDFMAAQPIVLNWTSTISGDWDAGPDFENGGTLQNCATTTLAVTATLPPHHSTGPSCVTIPVEILEDNTTQMPLVDIPPITLEKTSTGKCSVNVAAQNYRCGFELKVTNNGKDEFNAPMVLSDTFGSPKPTAIRGIDGAGWNCTTKGRDGTSCTNGALKLAPKESSAVSMQLTLPGQRQGGTFENCGTIGVGDDPIQQAMIAQTALNQIGFDVGAVDGKIGPNTRKGLRGLQEQLGLEPSGELSPAFFNAIGLEMAADATPSCVTVDLPPMPEPPLVCQSSTTVKRGNACVCRYKNMYQKDKSACGCVKGTRFVKGQGCKKVEYKPTCDRATTVAKGNSCQCRYSNMYKKNNKTSCGCVKGTKWVKGEGCIKQKEARKCPFGTIPVGGLCIKIQIPIGNPKGPVCDDPGAC